MSLKPATVYVERFPDNELSRINEFIDEEFKGIVVLLERQYREPLHPEVTSQVSAGDEYRYLVVNDKIRALAFVRRTDFNHYELMLTSLTIDQGELVYDNAGKIWDPKLFIHIDAVGPAFSGPISNWPDWKAAYDAALSADGRHVPGDRAVQYWTDIRQNYFYQSINPVETLKAFYYTPHLD
ncbi:hypothetical protein [Fibrella forsythiae]|uniref:Uncharacterized protein n=1 Tax=Fibrella forsythiae TaxID=2817061 RepID=A0ABS3JBG9_9BACT|nr:hypothetical protein [Fibrella forsythiae]MBO0947331.1 hypothetical protein [Fibrella forsythiae]